VVDVEACHRSNSNFRLSSVSPRPAPDSSTGTTGLVSGSMDDERTFLLEEFKALRSEIELYLAEIRGLERNTIIAVGAIWAWLIHERVTDPLAWSIPVTLTLVIALRLIAVGLHFNDVRSRIKQIEKSFKVEGWEHRTSGGFFAISNFAIGVLLLAASVLAMLTRESIVPSPPPSAAQSPPVPSPTAAPSPRR
jgi:hypothetical protein